MKRSPIKRNIPIRSTKRISRRKSKSKYATRERAPESWWIFVKTRTCALRALLLEDARDWPEDIHPAEGIPFTECGGVIEADHGGAHGLGRKSKDRDVAAICTQHHRERTDHTGAFKNFKRADMRAFNAWAIERTHRLARFAGVEIPEV